MAEKLPKGFRKTGHVYGEFRGLPMFEYKCNYLNDPKLDGVHDGCCHFGCRLDSLRAAGHEAIAARLEANAKARDWLHNWGKMLYDPKEHGRNPERRKKAAAVIRMMRNQSLDTYHATVVGMWAGVQCK